MGVQLLGDWGSRPGRMKWMPGAVGFEEPFLKARNQRNVPQNKRAICGTFQEVNWPYLKISAQLVERFQRSIGRQSLKRPIWDHFMAASPPPSSKRSVWRIVSWYVIPKCPRSVPRKLGLRVRIVSWISRFRIRAQKYATHDAPIPLRLPAASAPSIHRPPAFGELDSAENKAVRQAPRLTPAPPTHPAA